MTRLALILATAAAAATALVGVAPAAPVVNGIYDVPDTPSKLTQGPDGGVWVVVGGNALARFAPDGARQDFPLTSVSGAKGITKGPDGNLWITAPNAIVKVPPSNPAALELFTVNDVITPNAIVSGPDGNLWTASADKVLRISPAAPAAPTLFTLQGSASPSARGITSSGGLLWVVDFTGTITAITPDGATQKHHSVGGGPQEVAGSPSGRILYTNPGATPHALGRLVPGGLPQTAELPSSDPFGVAYGPDGAWWIAQFASGTLARVTVDGAVTTIGGLPATNDPREIAAGPGNTLWVSLEASKKVARVTGVEPPPAPQEPAPPATGGPGAAPDTTAPAVGALKVRPSTLRRGGPRTPVATFTLSEAARVTVTLERLVGGRIRGGRCRTRPPLGSGRRCVKATRISTFRNDAAAGATRVSIAVRRGRRAPAAGSYRVSVVAVDAAGNRSTPARAPMRISAR